MHLWSLSANAEPVKTAGFWKLLRLLTLSLLLAPSALAGEESDSESDDAAAESVPRDAPGVPAPSGGPWVKPLVQPVLAPLPAPAAAPEAIAAAQLPLVDPTPVLGTPARVEVDGMTVYEISVVARGRAPAERASAAQKALREAIASETPDSMRVEQGADAAVIYAGTIPLLQLTAADAKVAGDSSLALHADNVALKFRKVLAAEQKRSQLAHTVFAISSVVLMTLAALYLLRRTSQLTEQARDWIATHREKIPAFRVQSLEVIGPAAVRSSATLGVELGKWLGRLGIVYLWLLISLSQFAATQGYVQRLTGTLVKPLTDMLGRVAVALPLFGLGLVALGTLAVLVRFVDLFFSSAARGETRIPYIAAEIAAPMGTLLQFALVLASLLFAAPLLTGNMDGVLPRTGVVALGTLGLAATPLLASMLVGVSVIFSRQLKIGDFVVFGGKKGRVVELGLLSVLLEAGPGSRFRVPQILSLFHATEVLGPLLRLGASISVARLSAEAHDALKRGALSVGTQPEIEVLSVDQRRAVYRVSVLTERRDAPSLLLSSMSQELATSGIELGRFDEELRA